LGLLAGAPAERPRLHEALGICGHTVRFDAEKYRPAFSQVRDYHPVGWDLADDTAVLPPWPSAKNRVNWETVYGTWKHSGFRTDVCLMLSGVDFDRWKRLPQEAGAYGRSFAENFGPSGRGLVETVEIGNEPGHYSDEEYIKLFAAMAGGIRKGDPKLRIATCAARAQPSGKYFKSLDLFRDHLDLVDVITMHVYAETGGWPTWPRTFPEDPKSDFLTRVEEVVAWRDRHAGGRPVWVTEYGWDATTRMDERAGTFARWEGNVSDEAQAAYLVRATALLLERGAERVFVYFFDDKDEPKLHGSSGVMRFGKPKPSFHALAQMRAELGDFRLEKIVKQPGDVWASAWVDDDGKRKLLLWRGVAAGGETVTARFRWPRKPEGLAMAQDDGEAGSVSPSPVGAGQWEVEVGPLPVYFK
jgi:hypothetical protein